MQMLSINTPTIVQYHWNIISLWMSAQMYDGDNWKNSWKGKWCKKELNFLGYTCIKFLVSSICFLLFFILGYR